jgi:hypothetical protein
MTYCRKEEDPPLSTSAWGWRYHHLGVPTTQKMPGERYLPQMKFYVSGFDTSPFGIEWMRFEPDSPVNPLIQRVAHVAFQVDDLEEALSRQPFKILSEPTSPASGVRVAMIEHNGAPVELIEFSNSSPD